MPWKYIDNVWCGYLEEFKNLLIKYIFKTDRVMKGIYVKVLVETVIMRSQKRERIKIVGQMYRGMGFGG